MYISCIHSGASLGTAYAFSNNKYAYRKLQRRHLTPVRRRFAIFHHPGTRFRFDSIPTHWPESLAAKRLGYLRAASWRSQFFRYSFRGTRFWIERTCRPTPTRYLTRPSLGYRSTSTSTSTSWSLLPFIGPGLPRVTSLFASSCLPWWILIILGSVAWAASPLVTWAAVGPSRRIHPTPHTPLLPLLSLLPLLLCILPMRRTRPSLQWKIRASLSRPSSCRVAVSRPMGSGTARWPNAPSSGSRCWRRDLCAALGAGTCR